MVRFFGGLLGFVALWPVAVVGQVITGTVWSRMIDHAGGQRMLSQKMTKEFLQIAKGIDATASMTALHGTIEMFDGRLLHLKDGIGYAPPPSELVEAALDDVLVKWTSFKALLEDNMMTITPGDVDLLKNLATQSLEVLGLSATAVAAYVTAAKTAGADVSGLTVDIAGRQRMLTQRLAKEALLIGLEIEKEANLANLAATTTLFSDSHQGILRGTEYVGIPAATKMCTLWQMRAVTAKWSEVEFILKRIMDDQSVSDAVLQQVSVLNLELLTEMKGAVALYIQDNGDCDYAASLTAANWATIINMGGKQRMMGQKASRLFFQLARGVSASESLVELGTTMDNGETSLRLLIEGSQQEQVPAPPTQEIATKLTDLWTSWSTFVEMLNQAVQTNSYTAKIIRRISRLSRQTLTEMNEAVEMLVAECLRSMPSVNPVVLNIAGRQRMLMQQMSKEAILVTLNSEREKNEEYLEITIDLWLSVHWTLLLGREATNGSTALSRTTDVCLLRQMKIALDRFDDLRPVCQDVAHNSDENSSLTVSEVQEVDAKLVQVHELNGVAFAAMNTAVGMFIAEENQCDLELTLFEWQQVFALMGRGQLIVEQTTTEYLLRARGISSATSNMSESVAEFDKTVSSLKYGSASEQVPTPPNQKVADKLFLLTDCWASMRALLLSEVNQNKVDMVLAMGVQFRNIAMETTIAYREAVAVTFNDALWQNIGKASTGAALLQRFVTDTVALGFTGCPTCDAQGANLTLAITAFDDAVHSFDQVDQQIALQVQQLVAAWDTFKPTMEGIAETYAQSQQPAQPNKIANVIEKAEVVKVQSEGTLAMLIIATEKATRIPLDILVPLPLTGRWDAGRTMKTAVLVAQDIINSQQKILPGYKLVSHFFDDKCEGSTATQIVLQQNSEKDLVAMGGLGCQATCSAVSFVVDSMHLPFLSYACPGPELSDQAEFKRLTRMGNSMQHTPEIIRTLADVFGWELVSIVVGKSTDYGEDAAQFEEKFRAKGLEVDMFQVSGAGTFEQTRATVDAFRKAKRRVIFMLGDEAFKRRVVCASRVLGANIGIVWITEGAHSRGWVSQEDPSLDASCTAEDMESSFEGAINIADTDGALEHEEQLPLDCFTGHTAESFKELIASAMEEGYPVGNNQTQVEHPFNVAAQAADGTCALAYAISRLIVAGVSLHELRNPSEQVYYQFLSSLRTETLFRGASGQVTFEGNDRPGNVVLLQVQAGAEVCVGLQYANGTLSLSLNGGPSDEAYKPAFEEDTFKLPDGVIQVLVMCALLCVPAAGMVIGSRCLRRYQNYREFGEGGAGSSLKTQLKCSKCQAPIKERAAP